MLGTILRLYTAAMAGDVRTPVPHLFGPPGCGKSTFVEQAAQLLDVNLHSINVSRISPLELEGVQMPTDGKLELMLATYWSQLKDGDILFLDEFLRGFPEVYNGLLDILTSRTVAGHRLPKVFIIAASNSDIAYDAALTDRLLHLPVPDPRKEKTERDRIVDTIVSACNMLPVVANGYEMDSLMDRRVLPMYQMLDRGKKVGGGAMPDDVLSPRNLIGQVHLRYITDSYLAEVVNTNNRVAQAEGKLQYFIVYAYNGKLCTYPTDYVSKATVMLASPKLNDRQRLNLELNIQLIESHEAMKGA